MRALKKANAMHASVSSLAFSHHPLLCVIYKYRHEDPSVWPVRKERKFCCKFVFQSCVRENLQDIKKYETTLLYFLLSCLTLPVFFLLSPSLEYLTELREYGTVYSSWAESEEELHRPLEGVAGCVTTCCQALEDQSESMSQDFLPVLREYVLYIESMKVSV